MALIGYVGRVLLSYGTRQNGANVDGREWTGTEARLPRVGTPEWRCCEAAPGIVRGWGEVCTRGPVLEHRPC